MSLKITDQNGFKIGGVLNPSITEIYVKVLPNLAEQTNIYEEVDSVETLTKKSIKTVVETTLNYDPYALEQAIQVEGIFSQYRTQYSVFVPDKNTQFLQLEEDLKVQLIAQNPNWENSIEIV